MVVSFDDDFEEAMQNLDFFSSELVKLIETELDRLLRDIEADEIRGVSKVDRKGSECDGIAARSCFKLDSLPSIEPLNSFRSDFRSKKLQGIPRKVMAEMVEPLTDVYDKGGSFEVYVELPGAEKKDIQIKVRDGRVEVKAGNLHKIIELSPKEIVTQITSFDYRNGVLKIVIPKRFRLRRARANYRNRWKQDREPG